MLIRLIVISLAVTTPSGSWAQDKPSADGKPSLQVQCDAWFKEIMDAYRRYTDGTHKARTVEEARKFTPSNGTVYAARFLEIAKAHPDDPAAVDALVRVILVDFYGPHWREAIERIKANHVKSPGIGPALRVIAYDTTPPEVEPLLRAILKDNPSADVRAQAALALAEHLWRLVGEAENMREHPDRFEHAVVRFGADSVTRMRDRDTRVMRQELEDLLELVIRDYPKVPVFSSDPRDRRSLADVARAELRSIRDLVPGKPAPEIEGNDVDDKPMKLSDYRGKVVVLTFWATWCGPCMQMIPHERELVRRMEGKPFVLLGVNGDEDRDRLRSQAKEHQVNWRSWYDGGPHGPISTGWSIRGWPAVFVLDGNGVIRYRGARDEKALDEAVERLIKDSK